MHAYLLLLSHGSMLELLYACILFAYCADSYGCFYSLYCGTAQRQVLVIFFSVNNAMKESLLFMLERILTLRWIIIISTRENSRLQHLEEGEFNSKPSVLVHTTLDVTTRTVTMAKLFRDSVSFLFVLVLFVGLFLLFIFVLLLFYVEV